MLHRHWAAATCIILAAIGQSFAQSDPIKQYVDDLRNGPSMYYSDAAIEVLAAKDPSFAGMARTDKDKAMKSLRATALLGDKGGKAAAAIEPLLQMFPVAVHCVSAHEQYVAGAGTFEDWLQTKIMGEKNKFILTPPFLNYDAISQCDQYLDVSSDHVDAGERYGAGHVLTEAYVTITVTFRYFAGACALSRITGQQIGTDLNQWRSWWDANRSSFQPSGVAASPGSNQFAPAPTAIETVRGGVYHFVLTTGDDFTGTVDEKDDTSMIVSTREGKAFTFKNNIVKTYELVSLPAKLAQTPVQLAAAAEATIVTYDALLSRGSQGGLVEVTIRSGQTFRGALASVDSEMIHMTIEGSNIPIARNVVSQILLVPAGAAQPHSGPAVAAAPKGPFDTVIAKNPQTDDWGRPGPSFTYIGTISQESQKDLTIRTLDGGTITVVREQIEQAKKHTAGSFEEPIARYAKPLFCPPGMALVNLPPGKEGRPFFKVCIDKYEFPNQKDVIPQGNISFADARKTCEAQGKRLCTADEWRWACSGLESYEYPYGHMYDKESCNTASALEPSGYRYKCVSKFGANDMVGNIFEWTSDKQGNPTAMGGPMSKCQTMAPGAGGDAKPGTGFRCCKSN